MLDMEARNANRKRQREVGKNLVRPTTLHLGASATPRCSITAPPPRHVQASNSSERHHHDRHAAKTLDGFLMLDCCHAEFPDEVVQAVLSGMRISQVVTEDMLFFTNLARLDMSDNDAPFEPFGCLPQLTDLDFQCNALPHVVVGNGFLALEVLNLSFNCLSTRDVEELAALLHLRELFLAHNWIHVLPPVMERFSKLETLSLEENTLAGMENWNLLAMMPRLKHLNLSHNRFTAFPESALSVEDKRGAGFSALEYLNLSHNRIADERDIVMLSELRVLRKVVLYGNPIALAAVSSQDPALLTYDPVPTLSGQFASAHREVEIVLTVPDSKKKKRVTANLYENIEIFRMLPTDVPLPLSFDARAPSVPHHENRKAVEHLEKEEEMPAAGTAQRDHALALDTSDTTFLTGVGIEDVLASPAATPDILLEQVPAVPASILTRSLEAARPPNPARTQAALNALRYQLEHPLTSHDDSELVRSNAQRPTQAFLQRQIPRRHRDQQHPSLPSPTKPFSTSPAPFHPLGGAQGVEDALTQLSHEVGKAYEKRPSRDVDRAMDSLISTAQQMSLVYHSPLK